MKKSYQFPADTTTLADIGQLVEDACQRAGLDDAARGDVQLAVDEACTNAIVHGLEQDTAKSFRLTIEDHPGEIHVRLTERGKPFDYNSVKEPDPNAPLEEREIGGLGIFFVKQLMDEVDFYIEENGDKILTMIKRKV